LLGLVVIAGLSLLATEPAWAGFGDGMSIGDGSGSPQDLVRTRALRAELGRRINAQRAIAGKPALAGAALAAAEQEALAALRCNLLLLGQLANCQIEDDFGEDAAETWDEMLESGRVCVTTSTDYRGACRTDGVKTTEGDRINISLDILPFDRKFKNLCDLLLAYPDMSSSALTLYEEIRHAMQDWDWPDKGDESTEGRVRQRLRAVCNERDVDDLQLEATCDALDAIANLEDGDPAGATTEFGRKIAECLDAVMDNPDTPENERTQAFDAAKAGLRARKAFTGGTGDANGNGELDKGEDLNGDGVIDRPGTRACYDAGKQAYQAWLASAMTAADLATLNRALAMIRWATAIPGQLGPVPEPNPDAVVPAGKEPALLFHRGNSGVISQFKAGDGADHMLFTPMLEGVRDVLIVPLAPGSASPNLLFVAGSIEPGFGAVFVYQDPDADGVFDQSTEQALMIDPFPLMDPVGLVLPPGAPPSEMLLVLQNNPLFFPGDDIVVFSLSDRDGDGLPDQLGPPLAGPVQPVPQLLSFFPLPGDPQGVLMGPEVSDGTVSDRDAIVAASPGIGIVPIELEEAQLFPPYPIGVPHPGQDQVAIGAPPGRLVELFPLNPGGIPPTFDENGFPLVAPLGAAMASEFAVALVSVPPLGAGDLLIARLTENGALSVDIAVAGGGGCNPADLAPPSGVLDLADINAFVTGFVTNDPVADLAPPLGVLDLADINAFVAAFVGGCP